jgi:hypothetical protein
MPKVGLPVKEIAPSPLALVRDANAAIRRLTIESDRRHD